MTISKFAALAGAAVLATGALSAFAAAPGPVAPSAPPTSIVVFDKPNFKGQSMTFDRSVASLAALQFNDRPASVQIKGRDWVLCEHRNFMGKCVRIRAKERDLKRVKIAGQVSSMYPVPVPRPKATPPR
jgi:Beta/Gamma crystallin